MTADFGNFVTKTDEKRKTTDEMKQTFIVDYRAAGTYEDWGHEDWSSPYFQDWRGKNNQDVLILTVNTALNLSSGNH